MSAEPVGASSSSNPSSPSRLRDSVPLLAHDGSGSQTDDSCCLICQDYDLTSAQADVARLACAHVFCFPCIERWSQLNPCCPMCNRAFVEILRSSGEAVAVLPAAERPRPPAETTSSDFDCLDHAYFIEETGRLLNKVDACLSDLRVKHRTSVWEDRNLQVLGEASRSLRVFRATLLAYEQFEPWTGLQQLYHVQEVLQAVWEGPGAAFWKGNSPNIPADDAHDVDGMYVDQEDRELHQQYRAGELMLSAVFTVKQSKQRKGRKNRRRHSQAQ